MDVADTTLSDCAFQIAAVAAAATGKDQSPTVDSLKDGTRR